MARPPKIETDAGPVEFLTADGAAPAVLSIHGTPGGAGQAMAFAAHFRGAGLRVLAPSRPGYGATPLDAGPTFPGQADLLVAALDRLGVDQAAVFAISGGGPTALQLALRHPDRVSALVLEACCTEALAVPLSMWLSDTIAFSRPALALFTRQAEKNPKSAITMLIKATSSIDPARLDAIATAVVARPGMTAWLAELVANLSAFRHHRGYRADIRAIEHLPDYPLEEIAVPTLICHGKQDGEVPADHARHAAARIPGAELLEVEEAGHILALSERGAEVQERQLAFARAPR